MEEVHDAGELRQASAEARELEEQHPGPEQAPEDERLEDHRLWHGTGGKRPGHRQNLLYQHSWSEQDELLRLQELSKKKQAAHV